MAPLVLLADDSPHAQRMGAAYLEDLGCEVETARDGEAAWAALERRSPALILADAGLPGLSGAELCRRAKAHPRLRDIPFLILQGALARTPAEELAIADGVLRKPLSSAGLEPWLAKTPQQLLVLAVNEAARGENSE